MSSTWFAGPWAIEERFAESAVPAVEAALRGELTPSAMAVDGAGPGRGDEPYVRVGDVACLWIEGPLTKRAPCMSWLLGGTSMLEARRALGLAMQDPAIREIRLQIDSPGGEVAGVFEMADAVYRARDRKPVTAVIADMCCSGAYAIASQASQVVANRTALVGSIGVYTVVEDSSARRAGQGVKTHVVRSGMHKGAGARGDALTAEQLAEMQRMVDALHRQFVDTVARGRGMSQEDVEAIADGRVFVGSYAVDAGLVDAIVEEGSLEGGSGMGIWSDMWRRVKGGGELDANLEEAQPRADAIGLSAAQPGAESAAGESEQAEDDRHVSDTAESHPDDAHRSGLDGVSVDHNAGTAADDRLKQLAADEARLETAIAAERARGDRLKAALQEFRAQRAAAEAEAQSEALAVARAAQAAAHSAQLERDNERHEALVRQYVRTGFVMPAAEGAARKLMAADEALFCNFMKAQGPLAAFASSESRLRTTPPNGERVATEMQGDPNPADLLVRLAKERATAKGQPFHIAFADVCRERADLAQEHVSSRQ